MIIVLGFSGLGIDLGYLRYMKRQLQMVADAAALAGAMELGYCGGTSNCSALTTAAQNALTENGFTGSTLVTNCGSSSDSLTVTVNNPPCYLGTSDPHHGDAHYVEVVISQREPTYFSRIFGVKSATLAARAEAALAGGNNCIFSLDPTGASAISVDLLASVRSSCGIVDESSNNRALTCFLGSIGASQIGIVGNYSSFLCFMNPTPRTHITRPSPADPLAYLPTQTFTSCGLSTGSPYNGSSSAVRITSGSAVFNPGTYCGGIAINPGANVTFNPGIYILTSINNSRQTLSPYYGLSIDLGTTIHGNGVTFYNYGPSGGINFSFASFTPGTISLIAPTSGTYEGILFFQDPGNTSPAQITGTSSLNTVLQGTYYFPTAKVLFAFDGPVRYNILDAWQIEFAFLTFANGTFSSSGFSDDYSSLANGSPIKGSNAVLVE
jgi:hypothetical protein